MQAIACMYNTQNGLNEIINGTKPSKGKPYLGKKRHSRSLKGIMVQSAQPYVLFLQGYWTWPWEL